MYYRCPVCGEKFKYAVELIAYFGERFGQCPACLAQGTYEKDGARTPDDDEYSEVYE